MVFTSCFVVISKYYSMLILNCEHSKPNTSSTSGFVLYHYEDVVMLVLEFSKVQPHRATSVWNLQTLVAFI